MQFYTPAGTKRAWGDVPGMEVPTDQWTFVGVTFDGQTAKFYIDGNEFVLTTLVTPVTVAENTAQNVRVGHRQAAGAGFEFFSGSIDELRVYARTLSAAKWEPCLPRTLRRCRIRTFLVTTTSMRGWE
jgi:hypothetical protein